MPPVDRPAPPYMQVIAALRAQIDSGEIRPGELLPSDREIAAEWGISRATAQKAVAGLRAEGIVEAQVGVGTRVRSAPVPLHASGYDRAAAVRRSGRIYREGEYARIVSADLTPAPADVAAVLGIGVGAPAIRRVRVTYGPGDIISSASTSWYDGALADRAPRLLETARIIEGSWGYLEAQTGTTAAYGQDRISVRLATQEDADLLEISLPAAVKVAQTILRDADASAVEYGVSISGGRESVYDYDVGQAT